MSPPTTLGSAPSSPATTTSTRARAARCAVREQAVEPRDADVGDQLGAAAQHARGDERLLGAPAGPRCPAHSDEHAAVRGAARARASAQHDDRAGALVDLGVRERVAQSPRACVGSTRVASTTPCARVEPLDDRAPAARGVLPWPNTTSGSRRAARAGDRASRTRAVSSGASAIARAARAGRDAPRRTRRAGSRSSAGRNACSSVRRVSPPRSAAMPSSPLALELLEVAAQQLGHLLRPMRVRLTCSRTRALFGSP
mgnify:CR=1 FL=1